MKRIQMITGHYGSGKTEYAVNLALRLAAEGKKTVLADLDIVNPYFRSYEQTKRLEAAGIRVIVIPSISTSSTRPCSSCIGNSSIPIPFRCAPPVVSTRTHPCVALSAMRCVLTAVQS